MFIVNVVDAALGLVIPNDTKILLDVEKSLNLEYIVIFPEVT